MVSSLHNWDFELFGPNFGTPVTNRQEIFQMDGVSVHGINRSMMLTLLISPTSLNFSLFVSVLAHNSVTLLRSDQEFMGMGILVVAEASSSVNFAGCVVSVTENELIGRGREVSGIPPQNTTISRAREEFDTSS